MSVRASEYESVCVRVCEMEGGGLRLCVST